MDLRIISILDEQVAVSFTGKVNVLSNFNHQFLGHVLFRDGEIIQVRFSNQHGMKALYHLFLQEFSLQSFQYIIEPEVVDTTDKQIELPYPLLKKKMAEDIKEYQATLKHRPPENVKILVDAAFLQDSLPVSQQEFEVLATLTEWNSTYDIYQHCPLLDHEITGALVNLRKKSALKIVASRNNP
jgi:hypothetical protein